jgi:hypothetical protein
MDAAIAGLLGAVIGGGVALLKSFIDGRTAHRLELDKARLAHRGAVETELRGHVAAVARDLLACQHSMEWICSSTDGKSVLSGDKVSNYHAEIHESFPRLLGALAAVASLNDVAYKALLELANKVFKVDQQIAKALRDYENSPQMASANVSAHRNAATELYEELPRKIAEIMKYKLARDLK